MHILIKKNFHIFGKKYHFVVIAQNGKILCSSANYWNKNDCYDTAVSVKGKDNWDIKYNWDNG
jgi:uncharacterized protein YegP (UPF0339 family)